MRDKNALGSAAACPPKDAAVAARSCNNACVYPITLLSTNPMQESLYFHRRHLTISLTKCRELIYLINYSKNYYNTKPEYIKMHKMFPK